MIERGVSLVCDLDIQPPFVPRARGLEVRARDRAMISSILLRKRYRGWLPALLRQHGVGEEEDMGEVDEEVDAYGGFYTT
ncbi:hypothetical protein PsW74_02407 [Pseudovibrio sp. W74]|nr:hypothetical protein PsW74_02407 [Pseudovibrio sp. W74]